MPATVLKSLNIDRVLFNVGTGRGLAGGAPVATLERFRVAPGTFPDYDLAKRLLDATGARVVTAESYYCVVCSDPSRDYIAMEALDPLWVDFWWSALFHELTHWVAEGFRRVRWRGDDNHCELIAEIGATTLSNRCGIPMRGHIEAENGDMVQDWIEHIREDIGYLTLACAVAEVATGYVLNGGRWEERA